MANIEPSDALGELDEEIAASKAVAELAQKVTVERTGGIYSFASTEYRVTYPDGHVGTIWSPPWHELDDANEDKEALVYAQRLFATGQHRTSESVK